MEGTTVCGGVVRQGFVCINVFENKFAEKYIKYSLL